MVQKARLLNLAGEARFGHILLSRENAWTTTIFCFLHKNFRPAQTGLLEPIHRRPDNVIRCFETWPNQNLHCSAGGHDLSVASHEFVDLDRPPI